MPERDPKFCPYLGLPEDPNSFFVYATPIHRCHRSGEALPVHPDDQEMYCLSGDHKRCPRYRDPAATLTAASPKDGAQVYERYGWEAGAGAEPSRQAWVRILAISLAAVIVVAAIVVLLANQARARQLAQAGYLPPSLGTPAALATPTALGLLPAQTTPTSTPTPFATWTPTPTNTGTPTNTPIPPTLTPTFTATMTPTLTLTPTLTPTVTPTGTATPEPTATATPKPQFVPRSPTRYESSCDVTMAHGFVYDAYGNLLSGQTLKLWNSYGYSATATTEAAGQGHGEGYYEFYLYPGPYKEPQKFQIAVVDPSTQQPISPVLTLDFTSTGCQAGGGGRQIATLDWVANQ
jgi:hypothetical protein